MNGFQSTRQSACRLDGTIKNHQLFPYSLMETGSWKNCSQTQKYADLLQKRRKTIDKTLEKDRIKATDSLPLKVQEQTLSALNTNRQNSQSPKERMMRP